MAISTLMTDLKTCLCPLQSTNLCTWELCFRISAFSRTTQHSKISQPAIKTVNSRKFALNIRQ